MPIVSSLLPPKIDAGAAYVFEWNGTSWLEKQKLTASDAAEDDYFGYSVAVASAATAVIGVGAPGDDDLGSDSGSAYAFAWNGTSWVQFQKSTASDGAAFDYFGISVAGSGSLGVVGAAWDAGAVGAAYVYRGTGPSLVEEQKLTASDGTPGLFHPPFFGAAVGVSGNLAVVGAWGDDPPSGLDAGSAYLYEWNGASWSEVQKLTAPDGAVADAFGASVAISGDVVAVGAYGDDNELGDDAGAAYVFARSLPCTDGRDNDGDGLVDHPADAGCTYPGDPSEQESGHHCDDGQDNDGDNAIDLADAGCSSVTDPDEYLGTACDNGVDDDGDGSTDYPADPGCYDWTDDDETTGTDCDDGVDDDADGLVDLLDPGCADVFDFTEKDETNTYPCDDGFDNDADGMTDLADPGCASVYDGDEYLGTACDDGFDNDFDTWTDYPNDPGCKDPSWPYESPQCQDGLNNDNQTGIDFDGGASLDLNADGFIDPQFNPAEPPVGARDPQCANQPWKNREAKPPGSCGLGMELALLAPALQWLYRRRRPSRG